jgi:glycosyltransferase involved in cell wall biosynthesis
MRKKKIAYFGIKGLPARYGADKVVEAIASRLDHKKYKISVYCSKKNQNQSINGIQIIQMPFFPGRILHMISVNLLSAIHAVLFCNYDLIHLHNIESSFIIPILKLRYKIISTAHGIITVNNKWNIIEMKLMNLLEYPFVKMSNCVTSVSMQDAKILEEKYKNRIIHIPNGIDENPEINEINTNKILKLNGLKKKKYIIFVAGRIIPLKGLHLILKANAESKGLEKLLIVGDITQMPDYEKYIKSLLIKNVILLSFISEQATLNGLIKYASFLIFPSMQEAMSMVLLQAASLGSPILCSDIKPNKDILSKNALYFKNNDSNDLKSKIYWAKKNKSKMNYLGGKALNHVRIKYLWENIVLKYEKNYEKL